MTEIGLKLLDPIDHGNDDRTGALMAEIGRPQRDHFLIQQTANVKLDDGGGFMRDHVAPIFKPAAQHHDGRDQRKRQDQLIERRAAPDLSQKPAQKRQPPDTDRRGQQPHQHSPGNAKAHPLCELPKSLIEIHELEYRAHWRFIHGIRKKPVIFYSFHRRIHRLPNDRHLRWYQHPFLYFGL